MNKVPKRKWNQLISAHEEKRAELQSYLLSDSKSWHAFDGLFCATSRVIFCEEASKQTLLSWGQEMMMMMMWPCCLVLLQQSITVLRVVLPHPFSCVGTKDWWMPEWLLTPLKNTCCQLLATQLNFLVLTVANNSKGAKLSSRIECFHFPPEFKHQVNRLLRKQQVY